MAPSARDRADDGAVTRVSDAMVEKGEQTVSSRLREVELRLLIDVSRHGVIAGLAVVVFVTTLFVGAFGPASVQQYLLDGTAIADAYIELQPGIITAITIVLAINQLVLSSEFGALGHQRRRLEDVLSHRRDVEENADVVSSPTSPAGFLRTITEATREHLLQLDEATDDDDRALRDRLTACIEEIRHDIRPIGEALETRKFGSIELLGVAIHYDTTRDIHRIRRLRRTYDEEPSREQSRALEELLTALEQYDVAREYFRTRYLQTQFIRFSRAVLLTGLPALMVAHYSVGIIGPDVLPGATFGISNLLWFESATFTIALLPVLVIVSYVARIITLAETSIFVGPFSVGGSPE